MNLLEKYEEKQIKNLANNKIPDFSSGCMIKVYNKIVEGNNTRTQVFEGVCIARKNRKLGSSFKVKKISKGEGVEKTFLLYSPLIEKIEVVKRGRVRRAKLYYMRSLKGKAARLKEKKVQKLSKNEA